MFIESKKLKKGIAYVLSAVFIAGVISFVSLYPDKRPVATVGEENQTEEQLQQDTPENAEGAVEPTPEKKFIKWVDFNVPYNAMETALNYDIKSHDTDTPISWINILAYLGAKYGGEFSRYSQKDMDALVQRINNGETIEDITKDMKYFAHYSEVYDSILCQFVGDFEQPVQQENGEVVNEAKYGLKAFSPIAKGFSFSHYDDFGNSRTYGYARRHLGNDLMGSVGAPVIAVESGVVEALGWNMYGGWRIGIRSFDGKRYYYYAHLRKGKPYHVDIKEGDTVTAGQVIGYLGMTGYSQKEDVNNINVPHLHFGMQLIFDESQKEGNNEIWIDVYDIINLLQKHKSAVYKNPDNKQYYTQFPIVDPTVLERDS